MRVFILLLISLTLVTSSSFGTPVLHRYYDSITGEEKGLCYSGKDGKPALSNPDWSVDIIEESQKDFYIKQHRIQKKARNDARRTEIRNLKQSIKAKLSGLGLTDDEIDLILGD